VFFSPRLPSCSKNFIFWLDFENQKNSKTDCNAVAFKGLKEALCTASSVARVNHEVASLEDE